MANQKSVRVQLADLEGWEVEVPSYEAFQELVSSVEELVGIIETQTETIGDLRQALRHHNDALRLQGKAIKSLAGIKPSGSVEI